MLLDRFFLQVSFWDTRDSSLAFGELPLQDDLHAPHPVQPYAPWREEKVQLANVPADFVGVSMKSEGSCCFDMRHSLIWGQNV